LEKVGLVWKMPGFFFKRLKLDQLRKSRAFYKQALLFPENARLFRLKLRTRESISSLARAGTTTLFDVLARQATKADGIDSWAP
jgi:hypothetical protein